MTKYFALLRGINVGGHHKVPMAELRSLLSEIGLSDVKTYIQSGNIAFTAPEISHNILEQKIQDCIESHFGFSISVLIKTKEAIERIIKDYSFIRTRQEQSYYVLLHRVPEDELIDHATKKRYDYDHYSILNDCIYLFPEKGFGQSKFNMSYFERMLQTNATARNHRTMLKLLSLHDE